MAEEKEKLIVLDESKLAAFVGAYEPMIDPHHSPMEQHAVLADDCWLRNFFGCWYQPGGFDLLPYYVERLQQDGFSRVPDYTGIPVFHILPKVLPERQSLPLFTPEEQEDALAEIIGNVGEDVGVPMIDSGETHHTAEAWPQSLAVLEEGETDNDL